MFDSWCPGNCATNLRGLQAGFRPAPLCSCRARWGLDNLMYSAPCTAKKHPAPESAKRRTPWQFLPRVEANHEEPAGSSVEIRQAGVQEPRGGACLSGTRDKRAKKRDATPDMLGAPTTSSIPQCAREESTKHARSKKYPLRQLLRELLIRNCGHAPVPGSSPLKTLQGNAEGIHGSVLGASILVDLVFDDFSS